MIVGGDESLYVGQFVVKVFTAVLVLTVVRIRLRGGKTHTHTPVSPGLITPPPTGCWCCGSVAYLLYFVILFNDLIVDRLRRREKKQGGLKKKKKSPNKDSIDGVCPTHTHTHAW